MWTPHTPHKTDKPDILTTLPAMPCTSYSTLLLVYLACTLVVSPVWRNW